FAWFTNLLSSFTSKFSSPLPLEDRPIEDLQKLAAEGCQLIQRNFDETLEYTDTLVLIQSMCPKELHTITVENNDKKSTPPQFFSFEKRYEIIENLQKEFENILESLKRINESCKDERVVPLLSTKKTYLGIFTRVEPTKIFQIKDT